MIELYFIEHIIMFFLAGIFYGILKVMLIKSLFKSEVYNFTLDDIVEWLLGEHYEIAFCRTL